MKNWSAGFLVAGLLMFLISGAVYAQPRLEAYAELKRGPGNIAVTPEGQVIVSLHQFYGYDDRVVSVDPDGTVRPFPDARWNKPPSSGSLVGLDAVLGLRSDRRGIVWLLDNGMLAGHVPKLVGWDTRHDELERIIHLPEPISIEGTFQNDLAVDRTHETIYLADPANGSDAALVVVDLKTGSARRVLQGHRSVVPKDVKVRVKGRILKTEKDGKFVPVTYGLNPITISPDNEWVYYGPMSGTSVWRVRTRDLLNKNLSKGELASRVQRYGDKPVSAGITIDNAGNVYITDVGRKAIGVTQPDGSYRVVVQDDELLDWPDGLATGPDGYIYVTVNRLHKSALLNKGVDESDPPYYITRFKALSEVSVGR